MKYEKLPTEDYDEDAQELSVELATNVDSDEEEERMLPITEPNADDNTLDGGLARDRKRKRSKWVKRLHVFIFLFFTTVVVFTFLPSIVNNVIAWRHKKLFGGSCKDKTGVETGDSVDINSKEFVDLNLDSSTGYPWTQLLTLPEEYIPKGDAKSKNLVIVGDVHGMVKELGDLIIELESKGIRMADSHLVFAGDMISKGPHSLRVLDLAMSMNASCVRGNHEAEVMEIWMHNKQMKGIKDTTESNVDHTDHDDDDDEDKHEHEHEHEHDKGDDDDDDDKEQDSDKRSAKKNKKHKNKNKKPKSHKKKYKHSDRRLAKKLHRSHIKYLESCPLILKIDSSTIGDIAVVHAGMVPGLGLEQQKPGVVMNIRTFVKGVPTSGRKGVHWSKLWNKFQDEQVNGGGSDGLTVVYGHDARRGLDIKRWTTGLDTNCVRGGELTALVIKGGKKGGTKLVSVPCRKFA